MLDYRPCYVKTAQELDAEITDIFALDMVGRGDEIAGTLRVDYSDESVKQVAMVTHLRARGVFVDWRKVDATRLP